MSETILTSGLRYATYGLEVCVCAFLAWRGTWRRMKVLALYVGALLLLDGVGRSAVLHGYGDSSVQYNNFYYLTDFVLAVGAFVLVCALFHRACVQEEKLWRFIRVFLPLVFVLVIGVSAFSLLRNHSQLVTGSFTIEFSQNLYFTCLVLNTLLYMLIQQFAIEDDELALLACGLGVQFAGEAAGFALLNLTSLGQHAEAFYALLAPICTLGMLSIWAYAIAKKPQEVPASLRTGETGGVLEAAAES